MAAVERRQQDRRQTKRPVQNERRRDADRRHGRRAGDLAGPVDSALKTRHQRQRVDMSAARRAIAASREALKKKL